MPKTIETQVFTYDELSDRAKKEASEWYISLSSDSFYDAFQIMKDDARRIGLYLEVLEANRTNKGGFIGSAPETAESIMLEHGKNCETYKTAKEYLENRHGDRPSDSNPDADDSEWEEKTESDDHEFLYALLEDYRIMFDREVEFQQSEEIVAENIRANEYTFTEDGKRFG